MYFRKITTLSVLLLGALLINTRPTLSSSLSLETETVSETEQSVEQPTVALETVSETLPMGELESIQPMSTEPNTMTTVATMNLLNLAPVVSKNQDAITFEKMNKLIETTTQGLVKKELRTVLVPKVEKETTVMTTTNSKFETTQISTEAPVVETTQTETTTSEQTTTKQEIVKQETAKVEPVQKVTTEIKASASSSPSLYTLSQFMFRGVVHWSGMKFTYYSQRVLPGGGLRIPGRHVNSAGYVADKDGYIVIANDKPKGTIINTPFGFKGKVYDRGTYGNHYDVYVR